MDLLRNGVSGFSVKCLNAEENEDGDGMLSFLVATVLWLLRNENVNIVKLFEIRTG